MQFGKQVENFLIASDFPAGTIDHRQWQSFVPATLWMLHTISFVRYLIKTSFFVSVYVLTRKR
jgi:hypothetical protein